MNLAWKKSQVFSKAAALFLERLEKELPRWEEES